MNLDLPPAGRPPRPFRWHRLRRIGASLTIAGTVAAAMFAWWDRSTVHPGGPVTIGGGGSGVPLDVGEATSFGAVILQNHGKKPAILEKVRVLGPTDGFEVLGVRTNPVPLHNIAFFVGALGYPPNDYPSDSLSDRHIVPLSKASTPEGEAEERLQIVVGTRATSSGVARARGIEVTYRVGPRHYRRTSENSMYICAPREKYWAEGCSADEDYFHDTVVEFSVRN